MGELNERNYAEPLTADKAVFAFNSMSHGPMAQFLDSRGSPSHGSDTAMQPRGRTRAGGDFYTMPVGWEGSPPGASNPFESRLFRAR